MTQKKDTRFKPGQSGNPEGRKPGSGWVGEARKQLLEEWQGKLPDGSDGIRAKLIALAKEGDLGAIRLVAERVCPPVKQAEAPVDVDLSGNTLTERALAVLTAMGEGRLAPGQASQLLQGLGALAKIIETDELEKRIKALEEKKA